ncbi:MAG: glycosyltransferase family 2 protein [Candidatus Limiplasma sp.]|nr:glycosyltransferase family 2 protein [Candidatus Limiplasma sp.]
MPKVTVVMPSLNVAKYIRQCMESVLNQTLKDIEILCVDAGSTDGTLEILQEYAAEDDRITIIHSEKKSYGYQMNLGMDAAKGEYMGIVETDDYADPEMFEALYTIAHAEQLDVVKSGFYYYYSKPEERNEPVRIVSEIVSKRILCPLTDFRSPTEMVEFFNIKPTIWSAIYRLSFLKENHIRLNETPGASFQDTSFNFKVWACAQRVRLLRNCFLHYRQDNEGSSINSPGKVYCISDEYNEMERFLNLHPEKKAKLEGVRVRIKLDSYLWNHARLSEPLQEEFIQFAAQEFQRDMALGYFDKKYFSWYKWEVLHWIMSDPLEYHRWFLAEKNGTKYVGKTLPKENMLQKLERKARGGVKCLKEHGFIYTWKNLLCKIKRRILNV